MKTSPLSLLPEHPALLTVGVDEAGRGCLAGPVVAGAVILPDDFDLPGLDDSKKLTPQWREDLARDIKNQAAFWAVGVAWHQEIDEKDILQATFLAMSRAVAKLRTEPTLALIDGNQTCPHLHMLQRAIVGGDGLVPAISAASVMAKTWRDRLMVKLGRKFPGYGLEKHKGYGTKEHMEALRKLGPSPVHRMSFRGVLPEEEKPKKAKSNQACLPGI